MKIILNMVTSINGMIAREDGSEDWLPESGWQEFKTKATNYNNMVMGRETYEKVTSNYGGDNFDSVPVDHKIIVTHNVDFTASPQYTIVHSPEEAIKYLQAKNIETLFLIGGGTLNSSILKQNLVDELHLTICPYILGKGRPVFAPEELDLPLKLIKMEELKNNRVNLVYNTRTT